jgi:hypothetical protein
MRLVLSGIVMVAVAAPVAAEEAVMAGPKPTMLNVQLVMAKRQGDKTISSLPYALGCATEREQLLKIGVEVPIAISMSGDKDEPPKTSFQYRNVGTNISCSANALGEGRYRIILKVEQSSLYEEKKPAGATDLAPMFRTWTAIVREILRDGQTAQSIASSDPLSGETTTLDVTLKVRK